MQKKIRRKRGPVQAKKIKYDNINFASGLEKYMYMALKKNKIKAKYEGETFVLINGFHFANKKASIGRGAPARWPLVHAAPPRRKRWLSSERQPQHRRRACRSHGHRRARMLAWLCWRGCSCARAVLSRYAQWAPVRRRKVAIAAHS